MKIIDLLKPPPLTTLSLSTTIVTTLYFMFSLCTWFTPIHDYDKVLNFEIIKKDNYHCHRIYFYYNFNGLDSYILCVYTFTFALKVSLYSM